jgi:hypothetical protein
VTEIQTLMTTGVADMIAAMPTVATISGLAVRGVYTPSEQTAELGMGGFVNPQNAEFVCLTAAVSLPALMTIVTVGGSAKRLTGVQSDQGVTTLILADPEDVR